MQPLGSRRWTLRPPSSLPLGTLPQPWRTIGRHAVLPRLGVDEQARLDALSHLNHFLAQDVVPAMRERFKQAPPPRHRRIATRRCLCSRRTPRFATLEPPAPPLDGTAPAAQSRNALRQRERLAAACRNALDPSAAPASLELDPCSSLRATCWKPMRICCRAVISATSARTTSPSVRPTRPLPTRWCRDGQARTATVQVARSRTGSRRVSPIPPEADSRPRLWHGPQHLRHREGFSRRRDHRDRCRRRPAALRRGARRLARHSQRSLGAGRHRAYSRTLRPGRPRLHRDRAARDAAMRRCATYSRAVTNGLHRAA